MSHQRYKELRLLLEKEGIRHKELADFIGMNPARFSQKINRNKSNFTIDEASAICEALNISMDEYFFNRNVPKMKRKHLTERIWFYAKSNNTTHTWKYFNR